MPHVTDLFIAEAGSEPMQSVTEVHAVADGGLRGDRYFNGTGYYSPFDVCQVTLLAREAIEEINREFGLDLTAGEHRRNIVTDGIDVHDLLDHRFRVGDALLEGTRPRPPCAHVEQLNEQDGVARALKNGRGGICADVVESGRIGVGDSITDIESLDKTAGIIERLRSK
ncbi:MOSC domain-containing protein [Haladaptatus sp. DYF46]|uniref:MOSC domain-containing protein n=1 Tax=Haladaptatus sp. DYF46 TaxID=2886041 RepID=UPI001E4C977E|nr:MOSC domain-containing protein [Haladaptatus sp. DYF46]